MPVPGRFQRNSTSMPTILILLRLAVKHQFVPLQGALIHVGREKQAAVMRFALLGAVHCNIGFLIMVENFLCDIIGIKVDQNAASLYLTRFFLA